MLGHRHRRGDLAHRRTRQLPRGRWVIAAAAAVAVAALAAGCGGGSEVSNGNADADVGTVPDAAKEVFAKAPYETARWSYRVEDLDSGDVSLERDGGVMAQTGSTAKLFTIASAYGTLGTDHEIKTPVYALGSRDGSTLDGELVLVGMGDPTLGGRGGTEGRVDFEALDAVYASTLPGTEATEDDPLAGLTQLAAEVKKSGLEAVSDVVVDDRLFDPFAAQGGTVVPIFVADNQVTITVTPTEPGQPAKAKLSPETDLYDIQVDVATVDGIGEPENPFSGKEIETEPDPDDPNKATVTGTIAADVDPTLTAFVVPDPAEFARALFIQELEAEGVEVGARATAENNETGLPKPGGYSKSDLAASYTSPPLSEFGRMILNTSYNDGANDVLCLLAIEAGSKTCTDGLSTIRELIDEAGIEKARVALVDGQGGDPASVTPEAIVAWVRWTTEQEWGETFEQSMPVLGVSGTLKEGEEDSPARGKVAAKPGTSVHPLPDSSELFVLTEGLAGFLDTDDGAKLFSVYTGGAVFPNGLQGVLDVGADVNAVAAAFQQAGGG
jgi:D-alanyl-D-alanine carboxypeptidase/D-alanyl-D-alanine-endopeptidase (penicillin-binding protein 4)